MKYYQLSVADTFKELNTSSEGLSEREALLRLDKYGHNKLKELKKESWAIKFFRQFTDLLAIILIVAGLLSLIIGDPRGASIIFIIVVVNAVIGFMQEYKAEKILDAFKNYLPAYSKVFREQESKEILTSRIVPGDILILAPGDAVGADARIIESFDLKTNDFSLTGESQPQSRRASIINKEENVNQIDNMVFMGTTVVEGEARAIVANTGLNTEFGKIAEKSQEIKQEPTPLQKELNHTGKIIATIAIVVAIFMFLLLYFLGRDIKESFVFAIVAGAALCPEGLPAAMSIALSLGAERMLKKKALVKKLVHVESLGSVTAICTDKTGTLTTGNMSVVKIFPEWKTISILDRDILIKNMVLCNNASINKEAKGIGDFLEIAFLKYAVNNKINIDDLRKENTRIDEIPFSAKRKMMTVVTENQNSKVKSQNFLVYTKGACLEILAKCKISDREKKEIILKNDEMATSGLRVLAFAYKIIDNNYQKDSLEKDLNFLGIVGLEDPPREGVKEAIDLCRKAKIRVFMVTGDYGLTAQKIGEEINLSSEDTKIVTGQDLQKMDDNALKAILENEVIFARIDPDQKLRIVKNLQELKEVVAVTGDGVNDAPALVKADIGIAMGKIGTDVAKEASDMILLDDHFATIVNAVSEGRRIFDNAKKIVYYVFSSNGGELFVPFFGVILGLPLPLLAIQILAIDLGTDVFPSLALGVEKAEPGIMSKPPRSKLERIMSVKMLYKLLNVGLVMGVLGLTVFLFALYQGGWHYNEFIDSSSPLYMQATASVYATIVLCQFANVLSCRSEKVSAWKMFWTNKWLLYSELISFIMLFAMMEWKPFQEAFKTAPPSALSWILIIASFFIFLGIFEKIKKNNNAVHGS